MEERHRRLLVKQNPWWRNETITIPSFKRDLFEEIQTYISSKQILAIIGLRRVGKTILMTQILQSLDVPKNNICYISFDDIDFQQYTTADELINYFLEFSDKNNMRYLFFDEIQKLPNWADIIKTYYDSEENIKIIISGSASLDVQHHKESLAGRIFTFNLPVLTFQEFVRYYQLENKISKDKILHEYDLKFSHKKERYNSLFKQYILKGAFPELLDVDIKNKDFIAKYIKESVIEKTIVDISRLTKENEKIIYELLRLLANSTARTFEIVNLANVLGINRNRVADALTLLEKSFLIKITYNCTASVAKQVRTNKKQYLAHSCIVITMLDYPFEVITTEIAGYLVEGIISHAVKNASFWRTPQKDEVDIVIKGKKFMPIEVKYQNQITDADCKTLVKFCKKYKVKKGLVITKEALETRNYDDIKLDLIPAWVFLLEK